jgi:hypothetical protein
VTSTSGAKGLGSGSRRLESQFGTAIAMLKKLDHPIMWVILCSCFFAGFGFAVGEAVQRVNDAIALNAVYQHKNILKWAGEYFDPRMILFALVFVIVAALEASVFFYQWRLKCKIALATAKADGTAREVANETRALLACLNEFDLERDLWISITDAMKKT